MSGKQPKRKERLGVDSMGRSELHYAANDAELAKVQALLAGGAQPDLADDNGWTPLHFAAQARSLAVAEALLAAGAPIDARDRDGNTPLSNAVFYSRGEGELITLLRRHGADATRPNAHGVSPVALARSIGNYDIAQFFADLPQ